VKFDFVQGEGPRSENRCALKPTRARAPVRSARELATSWTHPQIKHELGARAPLIDSPARRSRSRLMRSKGALKCLRAHKALMYGTGGVHSFCDVIADVVGDTRRADRGGCRCVQIFDSWSARSTAADYREFILPHTRRIFERVTPLGVPTFISALHRSILTDLRDAGGD